MRVAVVERRRLEADVCEEVMHALCAPATVGERDGCFSIGLGDHLHGLEQREQLLCSGNSPRVHWLTNSQQVKPFVSPNTRPYFSLPRIKPQLR